jgi:hypothetical protein
VKISWHNVVSQSRRRFFSERWLVVIAGISLVFLIALTWILNRAIPPRVEPISLHYTTSFGVDLVGPRDRMFILPGFGLLVFLVNTILAAVVLERERIMSYFLVLTSFVFTVLLGFAVWTLIIQNR